MDSVFDLASREELVDLLGDLKHPGDAELFDHERELVRADPDYGLSLLACLHAMRGDLARADKVLADIRDEQARLDTTLLIHEFEVA